ncbi:hypothetical protein P9139_10510 [Curtobacterium flaccumfaciens]|nr:hypothetical protein P9139_10510 [Curtobacterium flaccumfaciens]
MHVASGSAARIDRIGLLEPVMTAFGVIAVAAAWQWAASAGSRSRDPARHGTGRVGGPTAGWPWMALAGAALAASVTSKVTTAVLVVALVAVPLLFRRWLGMLVAAVVAAVSFAIVFVLVYLPVGGLGAIEYMLRFQGAHNTDGHEISVLGATYTRAPWWSNGVYLAQGVGWPFLVVVVIGVLAAVVLRPDRLVALLGIAAAALMAFSAVAHVAHVALLHRVDAVPRRARRRGLHPPRAPAAAVDARARGGVGRPHRVLERTARGRRRRGATRRPGTPRHGTPCARRARRRPVALRGRPAADLRRLVPRPGIMQYVTVGTYGALVEGRDARFPLTDELRALVREHPEAFDEFRVDDLRVWVPKDGREIEKRGADAVLVG